MPRLKTTPPVLNDDREKGQRSLDIPMYINRIVPPWTNPEWLYAEGWRNVVEKQPFAVICRDSLINYLTSLDWLIEPVNSSKRDELRPQIDYYTKFFLHTGDFDYVDFIQWICKDMLDIPFGGAVEVGRAGDEPNGKVLWMIPLDGGTLFPYPNKQYPVGQMLREDMTNVVWFPYYAVNRIYYAPRTEIRYQGWSMPPPVRIYLALEALYRGDAYYANLLLDTPQVGILDLADMEKGSAEEWVKAWRETLTGIDPFKVPVLYEHEKPANFISFTRSPTELMFDKAILRYEALMCAGYGLGLSDVGIQPTSSGGETLAGSIRQERRSRNSGHSVMKQKVKAFYDRLLPDTMRFKFIDSDDELSVAEGRARLSTSQAFAQLIDRGVFTSDEARQQMIADGLISISIPENAPKPPPQPVQPNQLPDGKPKNKDILGKPVPVSAGGQGEVRNSNIFIDTVHKMLDLNAYQIQRLAFACVNPVYESTLTNDDAQILYKQNVDLIKSKISWKAEYDRPAILIDFIDRFRNAKNAKVAEKAQLDYVLGLTDTIVEPDDGIDIKAEKKYRLKIGKDIDRIFALSSEFIAYAVIYGLFNYFESHNLDSETIIVDNGMVDSIKRELSVVENELVSGFFESIDKLSDNIIMEDRSDGSST